MVYLIFAFAVEQMSLSLRDVSFSNLNCLVLELSILPLLDDQPLAH